MAFGGRDSYSTNSGPSFSNLDGVTIRLGAGMIPPKKVTLPLNYQLGNPADVLFMDYNFSLEKSVLDWTEAQKRIQEATKQTKEETIENLPEGKAQDSATTASTGAAEESQGEKSSVGPSNQCTTQSNDPTHSGNSSDQQSVQPHPKPNMAPFYNWTNSGILVPTRIASNSAEKNSESNKMGENKTTNSKNSFNIADFEGEEDPFENCELKVLNTMEELDKVLQASSMSSKQGGQNGQPQRPGASGGETSQQTATNIHAGSRLSHHYHAQTNAGQTLQGGPTSGVMSIKDVEYPDLDDIGNSNTNSSGMQNTPNRATEHVQFMNGAAHFSKNSLPSITSDSKFLPTQAHSSGNPNLYTSFPVTQLGHDAGNNSAKSFQEYMDHLNRHSHGQSPNGLVHNVVKAEEFNQKRAWSTPPPTNRLRSARSTPDLAGLEEKNFPVPTFPHSHSPPPSLYRTQTPPPRPSSGQDWNPYHPLPPAPNGSEGIKHLTTISNSATLHSQSSMETSSSGSSPGQAANQPLTDPYRTLPATTQRFVDSITNMGFPRTRVARAVVKIGEDDKKVVDHLCSVNRMTEKGFNPDDAETALHLFEQKEEKAAKYLCLVKQFRELGFKEDKIRDALVSCSLDENKALDSLFVT